MPRKSLPSMTSTLWTITKAQPRLWTTLQPGAAAPAQPGWLAVMRVCGTIPIRPLTNVG